MLKRPVRQFTAPSAMLFAAAGMLALTQGCPAPAPEIKKVEPPVKPEPPKSEDLSFDLEEVKLAGTLFVPAGFGFPGMVRVVPKGKVTLEKQRKTFAKAKANRKSAEAQVLVTLLWDKSKELAQIDKATTAALREETRKVLQDTQAMLGDQVDAVILQMLFTVNMWLGDDAAAIAAGSELMTRFADSGIASQLAPWVAYLELKNWQTAEAAAITAGWTLDDPKMDYLHAYVMAWASFRQRNYDAARAAIIWAARNWKSKATQGTVEQDLFLMLGRSGAPIEEAASLFAELTVGDTKTQAIWLFSLYSNYEATGYEALAAQALEQTLTVAGDAATPQEKLSVRQRQSTKYLFANQPGEAADAAIDAYENLRACGAPCESLTGDLADHLTRLSSFFHTTYSVTLDDRHYAAAKKIYDYYLTLNRPDAEKLRGYLGRLEETKQRAAPGTGKHDADTMSLLLGFRNQAVKGCYEGVLQSEPELKGSLQMTLSIKENGEVTGVATDPATGDAGLAAVAGCVEERARTWALPTRKVPGTTTVKRSYLLEPQPQQ